MTDAEVWPVRIALIQQAIQIDLDCILCVPQRVLRVRVAECWLQMFKGGSHDNSRI